MRPLPECDSHDVSTRSHRTRPLHILKGVLPITAARIPAEILAGITLAAVAVPEVMGYTKISGTRSIASWQISASTTKVRLN
jgi:MFS superfamily sulfate permease-like transporter